MLKIYFILILLNIIFAELMFFRVKHNERLKENILKQSGDNSHDSKSMFKIRFWALSIIPVFHIFSLLLFAYVFSAEESSVIKLFKKCN